MAPIQGKPSTKPPPAPFLWRIQGIARDGQLVTLGKYRTREEADTDFARFEKDGHYRNMKLNEITPPPAPAQA
jgi:hypothetical protein